LFLFLDPWSHMGKKSALGKGLNALLPEDQDEQASTEDTAGDDEAEGQSELYRFEDGTQLLGRVAEVAVERIRPNPYQPRQEFSEESLDELAASIERTAATCSPPGRDRAPAGVCPGGRLRGNA
jgi:hypothetical protein